VASWRARGYTAGVGGSVPEPASVVLFGSRFLGLAGVMRRKLAR